MAFDEETDRQDELQAQADPEPRLGEAGQDALAEVREHVSGTFSVRSDGAREDRHRRAERLRSDERGGNVLPRQGQEEHHAQADTLDGIQQTQPRQHVMMAEPTALRTHDR